MYGGFPDGVHPYPDPARIDTSPYYVWLALYNLIYVIPLLVIVMLFVITLGSRKLSAREGRTLKLLSGLMMLELGLALLFVPTALDNVGAAVALLLVAIVLTFAITRVRG